MAKKILFYGCLAGCLGIFGLGLYGCSNGNLFGGLHDRGDSGDIKNLLSDADIALREGDYSSALALYERVLNQDPGNAEALFGAAAAAVKGSGFDIGRLISNMVNQSDAGSSMGLAEYIRDCRLTIVNSATVDPDSLLAGIDFDGLNTVIDTAICRLRLIVSGASDGSISRDNIDVLVNLAILCTLRAVIRAIDGDYLDILNEDGSYSITEGANFAGLCDTDEEKQIVKDVVATWQLLNRAVVVLSLASDRLIYRLREDVADIIDIMISSTVQTGQLPAACRTALDGIGIGPSTYTSFDEIFDPPSGSC